MNTLYKILAAIPLLLLLLLLSCSPKTKSSLDIEAENEAQKWWDATVTQCGEDYYARGEWIEELLPMKFTKKSGLFQLKNANFFVENLSARITEADRLNGVEWTGEINVLASSHRQYDEEKKAWGLWSDGPPKFMNPLQGKATPIFSNFLEKSNGQWKLVPPKGKPSCSEIPK